MGDKSELRALQDKLQKERAELVAAAAPHRARYEELRAQIEPLEKEMREVAAKFREIEQPRLAEIDNQLGPLAVALGGRKLTMGAIEVPVTPAE